MKEPLALPLPNPLEKRFFVRFDSSGSITRHGSCSRSVLDRWIAAGEPVMQTDQAFAMQPITDLMVLDGEIIKKPANPARLDGLTIRDVPAGSVVKWRLGLIEQPQTWIVDDGEVELGLSLPGKYAIHVRTPGFLSVTFEVEIP